MKISAQSGGRADPTLSQAMDRLWVRFLPEIKERVAVLEEAAAAVGAGKLSASRREAAEAAAHKLAGVLGTFSLEHGTVLARELELSFSRESASTPSLSKRLVTITEELRAMIDSRPRAH